MTKVLIGADPEIFVRNPNSGQFVSAHNMINGTKKRPFKVFDGAVQVDGTALEINIDPAETSEQFVERTQHVLEQLRTMVDPGYEFAFTPVAEFSEDYFSSLPMKAKLLGCDPDFNAYTLDANMPPPMERPMRTGAGHIHIGWADNIADFTGMAHFEDCAAVAKQMDYYIGMWSLLWDPDNRRRSMYGRAGAFRPKPYGVEYRVPSNAWLTSPELMAWVFNAAKKGFEDLANGKSPINNWGNVAENVINTNDAGWRAWAPGLMEEMGLELPENLVKNAA